MKPFGGRFSILNCNKWHDSQFDSMQIIVFVVSLWLTQYIIHFLCKNEIS